MQKITVYIFSKNNISIFIISFVMWERERMCILNLILFSIIYLISLFLYLLFVTE